MSTSTPPKDISRTHFAHCDSSTMTSTTELSSLVLEKPNPVSKRMFRLYGILLLGYLCIILQGYDGSLMPAINAMVRITPPFFLVMTDPVC